MSARPPAPRRILLVGSGGREHALAWQLAAEPGVEAVIALPGSDAIAAVPGVVRLAGRDPLDPAAVAAAARERGADLVVVGPEAPLAAGVADAVAAAGIPVFGPSAAAARIESSKAFCRSVAAAAGVPMARGGAFVQLAPARAYARDLAADGARVVVKADGLAAGKGVTVCDTLAEAEAALEALFAGPAPRGAASTAPRVVVEERLVGPEASLIALCDGREVLGLAAARDHKRLRDGDGGPNTGGMGAYSPLPDLPDELAADLLARVHRPVAAVLAAAGTPFRGALYAGLILTPERGPALLEFNARFGDPEAPRRGDPIAGLDGTGQALGGATAAGQAGAGTLVFHAGTRRGPDGAWTTDGGRVLAVVGRGADVAAARSAAEAAADRVTFPGLQRRRDIAASPAGVQP